MSNCEKANEVFEADRMAIFIHVQHMGNIGNRMFQYMFARHLQSKVLDSQVIGYNIPEWNMVSDHKLTQNDETLTVEGNHKFNVGHIAYLLNSKIFANVTLRVFAQRMEYLPHVDFARALFPSRMNDAPRARRNELLLNIRGAEILAGLHKDYMPLSLSYYEKLISHTGLSPVFMGQIDDGRYGTALRNKFKGERFMPSISPLSDFSTILNSVNVACSISSFSWLAAWMSLNAEHIHLPLAGFLNPRQRPDIDLIPHNDVRFLFYEFPVVRWEAREEQISDVIEGVHDFRPFGIAEVNKCIRKCNSQY
jgi:hypothetical protein